MIDPRPGRPPAIVAPVMRVLGVTDAARSVAFYRDVLGFDVREVRGDGGMPGVVELTNGPSRIRLGTHDIAPDNWDDRRPPGSAIVFFETDDVTAMHATVRARGGSPTELEKVNWIKMQMFEIRDPDGHVLWFGQSYHTESGERRRPMCRQIMPEVPLDDVSAGVAYYRDVLGFQINYQQDDIGVMDRDDVRLLLIARTAQHKGIGSAYVYVEDADAIYAELRAKGASLQGEPVSQPWGLREFRVLDLEGNRITFGQPFE
ncbi:MAG: VOC family protein [Gemmatimonadaceae bacterium]